MILDHNCLSVLIIFLQDFLLLLVTLSFKAVNVKKIWFMKNCVMQERVLSALEDSGVFTSGGLVRDKVGDLVSSILSCLHPYKGGEAGLSSLG